ncbi:MAG: hypothetical protein IMZ50_08745 [Candidatus Atribacteria bacterium]|nr:hypothetical protein [Candidatus Atribacteria bacterium]
MTMGMRMDEAETIMQAKSAKVHALRMCKDTPAFKQAAKEYRLAIRDWKRAIGGKW